MYIEFSKLINDTVIADTQNALRELTTLIKNNELKKEIPIVAEIVDKFRTAEKIERKQTRV